MVRFQEDKGKAGLKYTLRFGVPQRDGTTRFYLEEDNTAFMFSKNMYDISFEKKVIANRKIKGFF
jgi:hypothetical protein